MIRYDLQQYAEFDGFPAVPTLTQRMRQQTRKIHGRWDDACSGFWSIVEVWETLKEVHKGGEAEEWDLTYLQQSLIISMSLT
jgi:hypothetical protein